MKEGLVKDETVLGSKVEVSRTGLYALDSRCLTEVCSVQQSTWRRPGNNGTMETPQNNGDSLCDSGRCNGIPRWRKKPTGRRPMKHQFPFSGRAPQQ